MWPDCACKSCLYRLWSGKTPLHLKTYDDTAASPSTQRKVRAAIAPRLPAAEPTCQCARCAERIARGQTPAAHLKKFDDTIPDRSPRCSCREDCVSKICTEECDCEPCEQARIEDFRDFESAYLDFWQLPVLRGCLDYDECTPKEMKVFVQDRGLLDPFPEGLTLKTYYIRVLNAADRSLNFRFLDLCAELRNHVYNELLFLRRRRSRRFCYPQILSTCHQCLEGTGLLYADNTLSCNFTLRYDSVDAGNFYAKIGLHNQIAKFTEDEAQDFFRNWKLPAELRKVDALDIKIRIRTFGDYSVGMKDNFEVSATMQNCLLLFASSIMDQHRLKKVKITFKPDGKDPEQTNWAQHILYPLRRIRGIDSVVVKVAGDLSPGLIETMRTLKADMQSSSPAFNTWHHACETMEKLRTQLDFLCQFSDADAESLSVSLPSFGVLWKKVRNLLEFDPYRQVGTDIYETTPLIVDEEREVEALQEMRDLESDLPKIVEAFALLRPQLDDSPKMVERFRIV